MSKKSTGKGKVGKKHRLHHRIGKSLKKPFNHLKYGRLMKEPGGDPSWHPNCNPNTEMTTPFWKKFRPLRRFVYAVQYLIPCTRITFSKQGIFSKDGRQLVIGKLRRMVLAAVPPLATKLQKSYGIEGGCRSCGASCKLLFQCPHWDSKTHLCSIYEDRPPACRLFPITPADISDRNIVLKTEPCGFVFTNKKGLPAPDSIQLSPKAGKRTSIKKWLLQLPKS